MVSNVFGPLCTIAISSIPDYNDMYILGDTFLRSYTSKFDYTNN